MEEAVAEMWFVEWNRSSISVYNTNLQAIHSVSSFIRELPVYKALQTEFWGTAEMDIIYTGTLD